MRSKIVKSVTGIVSVVALTFIALLPAQAAVQPSVEGGDIYRVRNITKNTDFTDPASADKCDQLQYRVRIHNPGPDTPLQGVVVKAVLPAAASTQNVSTVTVTADNASPSSVSDTATVNLSTAQKITYVPGSTQILNAQGGVISTTGDVTSGAGVNIGNVGISVNERRFVQFKASVDCPQQPPCTPPNPACTPPQQVSSGICKDLKLEVTSREKREVRATVTGEVTNATILGYKIDFGDGFTSTQQSETHMYSKDGTYTVKGQVEIRLANNTVVTRESENCTKQITFKADVKPEIVTPPAAPPTTPVTPAAQPTILPETGAAGVGLIAAAVSSLSSLGYYLATTGRRKFFN